MTEGNRIRQYAYYPGCSLEGVAISYHLSAIEAWRELGLELKKIQC
jgi:heterodisulfide reductase subunit B